MQDDDWYEYDHEIHELVEFLNRDVKHTAARVIHDPDTVYDALKQTIPIRRGGIDWQSAIHSSGPTPEEPRESQSQTLDRVLHDFAAFCDVARLTSTASVSFVSDDFFSMGIECEVAFARRVLEEWLPLPHALVIASPDFRACLHVTFSRSSYLFIGSSGKSGGALTHEFKSGCVQ